MNAQIPIHSHEDMIRLVDRSIDNAIKALNLSLASGAAWNSALKFNLTVRQATETFKKLRREFEL